MNNRVLKFTLMHKIYSNSLVSNTLSTQLDVNNSHTAPRITKDHIAFLFPQICTTSNLITDPFRPYSKGGRVPGKPRRSFGYQDIMSATYCECKLLVRLLDAGFFTTGHKCPNGPLVGRWYI
jgi:hypothetical protein